MSIEIEQRIKLFEDKLKEFQGRQPKDQISIIVFSGELDKAIASMIIATGARAMDMEVKMFFAFWGTTILRDKNKSGIGKDFMSKMFGFMLPKGSTQIKLSRLNMCGMGTEMLKGLMKKKNVASLEDLFKTAAELGVEFNICQMSMDLMGFKK